ncbi:hypothetical protein PV08_07530 [Exophiala spinifera]|uniref:Uncharacterized protein n=1 Tax=Exophiala spinifera TaxID=91928 RepID=A0A0D1YII0_9EURO|nr:uncharacterized protein PV08_07530 [Exophiala spinifera]KIW14746.1 hypothetical protein PV08_07530 [Exophiala spinifera]
MVLEYDAIRDLIQQLEADRRAYLSTFEKVHETLEQALNGRSAREDTLSELALLNSGPRPIVASPKILPLSSTGRDIEQPTVPQALTKARRASTYILEHSQAHQTKDSIFTGDLTSDSEDDESLFAQELLPSVEHSEVDLIDHLKSHDWDIYSKYILQDLLRNLSLLENGIFLKDRHHQIDANHQHADIYHVSTDGAPLRYSRGDSEEGPLAVWEALRSTNSDAKRHQAVGRIIIVREPPSSLFAALHLTMRDYFDMDSIYRMLIDDTTPTKAFTKGYLEKDHRRQRSVVFVFKYHTIIGDGRSPLPWQNYDDSVQEHSDDHIPLSTCSSVVALSLAGKSSHTLRRNSRKRKSIVGHIYDPFAPWHVLSIQCFPDWRSSVDVHETNHHYVNGPDAFLSSLMVEYRDAVKRFREVFSSIQRLATPPNRSIFDRGLRDELLFENDKYTYSRRYFWASQTLGLLSNEIKAMITAYRETFTDEFWSGEHKTLFPGTKEQSPKYHNWRKKLIHTRRQFEKEIVRLEEVLHMFQQQQKEIRNLREWLFSGTSVLESREAVNMAKITVEQGYNIRLLTLVTLFYLPLTFVTSIFGMTNMPVDDNFLPFAVTVVGICIPTYLLILIVNNPDNSRRLFANIGLALIKLVSFAAPRRSENLKKKILAKRTTSADEKQTSVQGPPVHASLEARLSHDLSSETSVRGSQGFLLANTRRMSRGVLNYLPGGARHTLQSPATDHSNALDIWPDDVGQTPLRHRQRSSTIKFEEPQYMPTNVTVTESEGKSQYEREGLRGSRQATGGSPGTMFLSPAVESRHFGEESPGLSPSRQNLSERRPPLAGSPTYPATVRTRSFSPGGPDGRSLLRRLSERLSALPRSSDEGSKPSEESV